MKKALAVLDAVRIVCCAIGPSQRAKLAKSADESDVIFGEGTQINNSQKKSTPQQGASQLRQY